VELAGKTLGILGFGEIGRRVAAIAHFGFRMRVLAADVRSFSQMRQSGESELSALARLGLACYTTDVQNVFRQSDVVTIHCSANAETRGFINAERLRWMKPGALLVNTARGSLVDEDALYDALAEGRLGGAALDVFQNEPYVPATAGKDLRSLDNVVLTPHIGSNTEEANRRMAQAALKNVLLFFEGRIDEMDRV
jgi:lactate dehydrogenase-like 2-hydroxyacid dehydrogenase